MNAKHFLLFFFFVSISMASMPFRGTIQTSTGTPIEGAKVIATVNREVALSNSSGQFGSGGTAVIIEEVGTLFMRKPVLQKNMLYFNADMGVAYSYRLLDARGRAIVQLSGTAEQSGMQCLSLKNYALADGFYISILQVGKKREVFKSVVSGKYSGMPQLTSGNSVSRAQNAISAVPSVSLIDTLYITANGYKNKIIPLSDTGSVGIITLDAVGSEPEIYCHDISLAYTPSTFPLNRKDTVALTMSVFNGGGANALSVKCSIATADSEITIVEPIVTFDNIAFGASKVGMNEFKVLLPRTYKRGENIPFRLYISDSWGGSWDCAELYMPYPFMVAKQKLDEDTLGSSYGNNNGLCEKGELIEYTPLVKNVSQTNHPDVDIYFGKSSLVDMAKSVNYPHTELKKELGELKIGEQKLPLSDFLIFTKKSSVSDYEQDLLIKADEYYLLPIDLNSSTLEAPEPTNAILKGTNLTLAFDERNFPRYRGDTMVFALGIENIGTENAYSVSCSLSTQATGVSVESGYLSFDNIAVGDTTYPLFQKVKDTFNLKDSIYSLDRLFKVRVPRSFPAGVSVDFVLHMKDSWGKTWLDTIQYMPHPFAIALDMIDDDSIPASKGDGDSIIEVGEIIEYIPQLQNFSGETIENIIGEMMKTPSFTYTSASWSYGSMANGAKKLPEFDYVFKVENDSVPLIETDMLLVSKKNGDSTFYVLPLGLKAGNMGKPSVYAMSDTIIDVNQAISIIAEGFDYNGAIEKYVWALDGVNFKDTTTTGEISTSWEHSGLYAVKVKVIDNEQNESLEDKVTIVVKGETFKKSIPGGIGTEIALTPEEDFVIVGSKETDDINRPDVWVVKVNQNGDTLWTKTYGSSEEDKAFGVDVFPNNDIVVVGYTDVNDTASPDLWILKLNPDGDTLWTKIIGNEKRDYGNSVKVLQDNTIAIIGRNEVDNEYTNWVLKLDTNGTELWSKGFGAGNNAWGRSIMEDGDNNLLITGQTTKDYEVLLYIAKIDPNGDLIWEQTSKDTSSFVWCLGESVVQTEDNGYLVSGMSRNNIYNVKFDYNGNKEWEKTYDDEEAIIFSSGLTSDNAVVVVGHTIPGEYDLLLKKYDENGELLWKRTFSDTGYCQGRGIEILRDGSFAITGYIKGSGSSGYGGELLLLKTNADGSMN